MNADNVAQLPVSSRSARTHQTTPIGPLETIRMLLELSHREFAEAMGYSGSSYSSWVNSGQAPKAAALAAEALMRRQATSTPDHLFLIRVVKGIPQVTLLDDPRTLRLDGVDYLLVPR